MKVILIDDEKHALITLAHLLEQIEGVEILTTIQDSTQAREIIEKEQPDLVFLDVEMPKMNGFELLEQFNQLDFKVIFTTAYDQYAIKALKMNAFDYLLKPIDLEDLENSIRKFRENEILTSSDQVAQLAKFNVGQMNKLALSTQKGLSFIKVEEIMYFSASGTYTYVFMDSGEKHLVSKPLSVFEDVFQDDDTFFRAHKSNLINLRFVKEYIRGEGGDIVMQDNTHISLSRNKKQEFLSLFRKV